MTSSRQRTEEPRELEAYGRVYDFGDFVVVARCFAFADGGRRLELHLQACGQKAVVDVPDEERRVLRDRIAQAAEAFADSIRLSGRC
jgi:hypothetical protein